MRVLPKAKITVEVDTSCEIHGRTFRISFKSNENGLVELDLDMALISPKLLGDASGILTETEWQIEVTILTLGDQFSLIQLPGETMLGHRNVIVANSQLEFV